MAAPLSGAVQPQQIPVSQSLQPNNAQDTRNAQRQGTNPSQNQVQVRQAPAAQTQESETDLFNAQEQDFSQAIAEANSSEVRERGSVIDIQV